MPRSRPTDAERWERARRLLERSKDDDTRRFIARRRWIWLFTVVGCFLFSALIGVLLALLAVSRSTHTTSAPHHVKHPVPVWSTVLGVCLVAVALAAIIVGFAVIVRRRRAGTVRSRWAAPTAALTFAQRRSLMKQVRGRAPADPSRLWITRDLAQRIRAVIQPVVLVLVGLAVYMGGVGFLTVGPAGILVILPLVIIYSAVLSPFLILDYRRAGRFLTTHSATASTL